MSEIKLNLARKWRSKQFEEIVGQDLSVRMLKNSLFLQQFFPVYLFSGQRGCGKTTTARVFAAALNCEQLETFQKNPQTQPVPCQKCTSCTAMERGKHPDFIEIDAASHTGVDHVRMLIDSASLLPLMGTKKIYLIDEAHMLSKAAFNALLKILEEPPSSVLFILATTDPHKIIETVRSRCFQLFFRSVDTDILLAQLQHVCTAEKIAYDDEGLTQIIKQTEGSVRDALNLLETVRFSNKKVTASAVAQLLGRIDDQALIELCAAALTGEAPLVLQRIKELQWQQYSAPLMWERLLELVRAALWVKHDVMPNHFNEYLTEIKQMTHSCSVQRLMRLLRALYDKELLFNKTTAQHDVLEMVLLSLCSFIKKSDSDDGNPSSNQAAPVDEVINDTHDEEEQEEESEEEEESDQEAGVWQLFIKAVDTLDDPLLSSLFTQGTLQAYDQSTQTISVEFSKELVFFEEWLASSKQVWLPLLHKVYKAPVELQPLFTGPAAPIKQSKITSTVQPTSHPVSPPAPVTQKEKYQSGRSSFKKRFNQRVPKLFPHEMAIDTADATAWPLAHLIKKHIPGTVTELRD